LITSPYFDAFHFRSPAEDFFTAEVSFSDARRQLLSELDCLSASPLPFAATRDAAAAPSADFITISYNAFARIIDAEGFHFASHAT